MTDNALTERDRRALERFRRQTESAPLDEVQLQAGWRASVERAHLRPSALPKLVLAFVAACALGSAGVWALRDEPGTVIVATSAELPTVRRQGETLFVDSGKVSVTTHGERLTVVTPQLQLQLHQARVLLEVGDESTTVIAEAGEVLHRGQRLKAGEPLTVKTGSR